MISLRLIANKETKKLSPPYEGDGRSTMIVKVL